MRKRAEKNSWVRIGERSAQSPSEGPITRLIVKPVPKLVRNMATAMLQRARKEGRALRAKRQLNFDGPEKAPTRNREACFSPLTVESEDPSAPPVAPPAEGSEAIVRTSTPNDSGLVSEGDGLPSYEALLAERFSPISSPPLVASILSSVNEDPVMAVRTDVKLTELKAAPAETPAATSVSEAGPSGVNLPPIFQVPPPNLYLNITNAPVGSTLVPRATIDTPCSRICVLVPAQHRCRKFPRLWEPIFTQAMSKTRTPKNFTKNTIFMPQFWPGDVKLAPGDVKS